MDKLKDILDGIVPDTHGLRKLYDVFHSIPDSELPIIRFSLCKGSSLIRQRINIPGKTFSHVSELTYPPMSVTQMERANIPGHPMFYACKFPSEVSEDAPIPRMISLMETSTFMKDKANRGIERATVSRWIIVEDLELAALPFIGDYAKACPDLNKITAMWNSAVSEGNIPPKALELVTYMAEEISKGFDNRNQYFKIANFVSYLMTTCAKTKNLDGIIYPSVQAQGAGLNVAIKPISADSKIHLSNASICHLVKNETQMNVFSMKDALIDEYGNITWVDRDRGNYQILYYEKLCDGLRFVN